MIRGPAGDLRNDTAKPKRAQIEFVHEDIDDPNRVVLIDPVCQAFRKQSALSSIQSLTEAHAKDSLETLIGFGKLQPVGAGQPLPGRSNRELRPAVEL